MVFDCSSSALGLRSHVRSLHSVLYLSLPEEKQSLLQKQNGLQTAMKSKHSASALKEMALSGSLVGCEMRSFAANHSSVLDASNHTDYVEAFVLQIGQREQHGAILSLLSSMDRAFSNGKIAYKPPGERQLTSVLDVGRWVSKQVYGGLAHEEVRADTCGPTQRHRDREPMRVAARMYAH